MPFWIRSGNWPESRGPCCYSVRCMLGNHVDHVEFIGS